MNNYKIEKIINKFLKIENYEDYAPNGLQIEGKEDIKKIITGVSASKDFIKKSVENSADAILVHHGYFWNNEPKTIIGAKKDRIKLLLENNINLYSYHLPLDGHPTVGNNIQLAKLLQVEIISFINPFLIIGKFNVPITTYMLSNIIYDRFNNPPRLFKYKNQESKIYTIAISSGNGQNFIHCLKKYDVDAFLTGEISENIFNLAKEMKIHFYALGHYATEKYGVQALGEWIKKTCNVNTCFVDINSPV
ncbi:hypothetical protein AOQ88_00755 [Candidatus Riesia sp. GBBU]|nr:hypothetical protein AOQ88_00755 [Candidatus Riesia sp. GBBU]